MSVYRIFGGTIGKSGHLIQRKFKIDAIDKEEAREKAIMDLQKRFGNTFSIIEVYTVTKI